MAAHINCENLCTTFFAALRLFSCILVKKMVHFATVLQRTINFHYFSSTTQCFSTHIQLTGGKKYIKIHLCALVSIHLCATVFVTIDICQFEAHMNNDNRKMPTRLCLYITVIYLYTSILLFFYKKNDTIKKTQFCQL